MNCGLKRKKKKKRYTYMSNKAISLQKKKKQMNFQKRKRLIDLEKKLMTMGMLGERDSYEAGDGHVHTTVFKIDIQQTYCIANVCVCIYIYI